VDRSLGRIIDGCNQEIPKKLPRVKFINKIKATIMPPKENAKEEEELEKKIAKKYLKYDQRMLEERL